MKKIYCISGLGSDENTFGKIDVPGYQLQHLPWMDPVENETMEHYAARMKEKIEDENPVLMGVSFGGMMCIEIAKQLNPERVIIISSVKGKEELPLWMKAVAKLKLNKIAPMSYRKLTESIQNYFLGVSTPEERAIVDNSRKKVTLAYMHWAINQAVNWKNQWQPSPLFHIHGTKDRIFPVKNAKKARLVNDGGHLMILSKYEELNAILKDLLNR